MLLKKMFTTEICNELALPECPHSDTRQTNLVGRYMTETQTWTTTLTDTAQGLWSVACSGTSSVEGYTVYGTFEGYNNNEPRHCVCE